MDKRYSRYYTYIKPVTKLPIIKSYGLHILTIVTLTIFIVFAIKPTIETIITLQKKLTDQQEILKQITKKSEDLTKASKNYQSLDPLVKQKIEISLPTKTDLRTLTNQLEQSALITQASISALQVQPLTFNAKNRTDKKSLSEISFTYNIEGSYQNLLRALDSLQKSNRLISIDSLTLNKVIDSSTILMSVTGKAYYLK